MRISLTLGTALFLCAAGCAAPPAPVETDHPLPPPATFHVSGTLDFNLTPQLAAQAGLPPVVTGSLEADAWSEAVAGSPLRSRYEGHLKFKMIGVDQKPPLADVNLAITGESAGPPAAGLGQVFNRFPDAVPWMTRPLSQGGSAAR